MLHENELNKHVAKLYYSFLIFFFLLFWWRNIDKDIGLRYFLIFYMGVTLCLFGTAASKGIKVYERMKLDKWIWSNGGMAGNLKLSEKTLPVLLIPQKKSHVNRCRSAPGERPATIRLRCASSRNYFLLTSGGFVSVFMTFWLPLNE